MWCQLVWSVSVQKAKPYFSYFLFALLVSACPCFAQQWNLPQDLRDDNTTVKFSVDSTWHEVKGTTAGIRGRVWLEFPNDPRSIRAEVRFPVSAFDTANERRDKRLREVMNQPEFPTVAFTAESIPDLCPPEEVAAGEECRATLKGKLKIRGVEKTLTIPITVSSKLDGFEVDGETEIRWPDFGVEDPSIFLAKLHPRVLISFSVMLRPEKPFPE